MAVDQLMVNWDKYKGKENTQEIIFEKGQELAGYTRVVAAVSADAILRHVCLANGILVPKEEAEKIYEEVKLFFVHVVERYLQWAIKDKTLNPFLTSFFASLDNTTLASADAYVQVLEDYRGCTIEYANLEKLFPDGSPDDDLAMSAELIKRILNIIRHDFDRDDRTRIENFLIAGVNALNLKDLIRFGEMSSYNPYEVLDIEPNSSIEEIKRAYRKKAFETHPDRSGGSKEEFLQVNGAYQILSNENKRKQYDENGKVDWRATNYEGSLDELLDYLKQEVYLLVLHGKSASEIRQWLVEQGCPQAIIIQLEKVLRKKAVGDTRKGGLHFAVLHLILFGLSIVIVFLLQKYKSVEWVGILASIILFFTYWPRAIQYIVIGFSSAIFGKHPLSWSEGTLKFISYSPLIFIFLLVLFPYLLTDGTNQWSISISEGKCYEISRGIKNKLREMRVYKQFDYPGPTIYTDDKDIYFPVFEDLESCMNVLPTFLSKIK